jgi:hypothetical protein
VSPALIWDSPDRPAPFTGSVLVESDPSARSEARPSYGNSSAVAAPASQLPSQSEREVCEAIESVLSLVSPESTQPMSAPKDTREPSELSQPGASQASATYPPTDQTVAPVSEVNELQGSRFCTWLRLGIAQRRIIINDAKALVHTVAGTAFLVTPGIFMRYAQEHREINRMAAEYKMAGWQWIQKHFERQRLHRKQANGLNVWACEVKGPRKTRRVHGYVLQDATTLFADVPPDNPYLTLLIDAAVPSTRFQRR